MIINTGCRTDIPAFYSKWLINRIREGYVLVRNPYYPSQITKYLLNPEVVDCIEFCTKNPEPILKYLDELDKFKQDWFVTITPYGKDIEPNVPDKEKVIESFKKLSDHFKRNYVGWRYDPIFINDEFDVNKHIQEFEKIAKALKGYTRNCVISFLDLYEKVKRNAPDLKPPTMEEQIELSKAFVKIGKENDMTIYSCCDKTHLAKYGVNCSGCKSQSMIEDAVEHKIKPPKKKNIREDCNCLMGTDIGAYNTCGHLCTYCCANENRALVKQNIKEHSETSPLLIGEITDNDKITEANQKSWVISENNQISFI